MARFAIFCHSDYYQGMASQSSMNISLPDTMRRWVEDRVETDGFGTVSEFFRSLVREEQKRRAREQLDCKLIEALDSGDAVEMTSRDWDQIRQTVRERLAAKAKGE